jgi:hypothetical protein
MALGREIKPWVIRGRTITPDDVQAVQRLVTAEPGIAGVSLACASAGVARHQRAMED